MKDITSMVATSDSKNIFVGDQYGHVQKLCVRSQKVLMDYGRIGDHDTFSILLINDDSQLVIGSRHNMKVISTVNGHSVKEFGAIHDPEPYLSCISYCQNYWFTWPHMATSMRNPKRWSVKDLEES